MKTLKNTTVTIIESGIEDSKNFRKDILNIFENELKDSYYSEMPIVIEDIYLTDVNWGNAGYGRFSKSGYSATISIKGYYFDEDGDKCIYENEIYNYMTVDSHTIDFLTNLEIGTKKYSDAKKRIAIELLENNIEDIAEKLNSFEIN